MDVNINWVLGASFRIFDKAGKLVAAHRIGDTSGYCGKSFSIDYGTMPKCTMMQTMAYCRPTTPP